MAEQNRLKRELETREKESRPAEKWTPPQLLPEIEDDLKSPRSQPAIW